MFNGKSIRLDKNNPDIYKKFIEYYSDGKYINSDWFVFMFIRQFNGNYVGDKWDGTAVYCFYRYKSRVDR